MHHSRGTGQVYYSDNYPPPWGRVRRPHEAFYDHSAPVWRASLRRINNTGQLPSTTEQEQQLPFVYQVANNFETRPIEKA